MPSAGMSQAGNHVVSRRDPAGRRPQDRDENPSGSHQYVRGSPRAGGRG